MALREILTEPNEILRKKSLLVDQVDGDIQKLMDDMLETMYLAPGIGLAAIQVGVPKRVIVLDIARKDEPKNPMYFINPEIITKSKDSLAYEEGCLSVPGQFAEITRSSNCYIKYLDYYGQPQELKTEGLLATCIQHEIDHLEGILFIDYLSKLKKTMIVKKLSKEKKQLDRIVV
jgi:peptide deformylase|tara:strand:- start:53 stop:577 length:525 start_codon:yes stop_codon:yes gene_type:complete